MKSVAIIGTGIAGMASAYFLRDRYDLTIYEKNSYVGGHTNTVFAKEGKKAIPIDTGFMVYNEVTYPNLTRLFKELKVETKAAPMSFSVQHRPSGLEFCGSGIDGLFAQRRNLLSPNFWSLLRQISRFNAEAIEVLSDPRWNSYTLSRYVQERGYGRDFLDKYLVPMSSAVWSTPPDLMIEFPAVTLIRFFHNHGFLGLNTQHPWRTVVGGSQGYREKIIESYRDKIKVASAATHVVRRHGKVLVKDSQNNSREFDAVICAAHANETLGILDDADAREKDLLGAFSYGHNRATLHTDSAVMPKTSKAWCSWNYRLDRVASGELKPSTIYYMNSLQGVSKEKNYFVSINDPELVSREKILREIDYEHPIFSLRSIQAQAELPKLNERGLVFFCGSYFRYGFHEDALTSAIDAVQAFTGQDVWAEEAA